MNGKNPLQEEPFLQSILLLKKSLQTYKKGTSLTLIELSKLPIMPSSWIRHGDEWMLQIEDFYYIDWLI